MLYVLALLVAIAVVVALWKLLAPQAGPGPRPGIGRPRNITPPDDDPDFLRELDERARRRDDEEA